MPIEKFHLRREGEGGWDCLEQEKKRKEVAGRRSKLRNLLSKDEISSGAARLNFNPAKKTANLHNPSGPTPLSYFTKPILNSKKIFQRSSKNYSSN